MTTSEMSQYLGLVLAVIAILGHAKLFFSSGEKALAEALNGLSNRLKALEDGQDDQGRRLQAVENDMRHLPTRESQHRMELQMEQMNGRLEVLTESIKPIRENSLMIGELLRKQVTK